MSTLDKSLVLVFLILKRAFNAQTSTLLFSCCNVWLVKLNFCLSYSLFNINNRYCMSTLDKSLVL